jgi:hypothetical protein
VRHHGAVQHAEPPAHAHRWLRRIATVADAIERPPAAEPAVRPRFFLGIDPGMTGALAVLDARGVPVLLSGVPLKLVPGRKRALYDLVAIRALLAPWRDEPALVVVEWPGPMPPRFRVKGGGIHHAGGSLANHARGVAEGWAWMLIGIGWARELVHAVRPQAWQEDMLAGVKGSDTGQRAIAAARRRWPRLDLRRTERCTTPDLGRVDALLLAEHGRKRWREGLLT